MKIKNKQIKRIAEKMYALELCYQDSNLSDAEKKQIENQIMALSKQVMQMPNPFEAMAIIDEYCLEKLSST